MRFLIFWFLWSGVRFVGKTVGRGLVFVIFFKFNSFRFYFFLKGFFRLIIFVLLLGDDYVCFRMRGIILYVFLIRVVV